MVLGISVVLSFSGCNNSVTQEVQEKQQVSETPEAEQDIKEPEKIMQEPEATPEEIEEAEDDTPTSPDMDIQATTLDELIDTMMAGHEFGVRYIKEIWMEPKRKCRSWREKWRR